jgi:integrase
MVGKTFNNGKANIFAVRSIEDKLLCPVKALEDYVYGVGKLGIDLSVGYLFRPVSAYKKAILDQDSLSYGVVYERFKHYLKVLDIDEGETPHSLRRGCAITLSLSGTSSKAEIMKHVGWFSQVSLDRYNELANIVETNIVSSISASARGTEELYVLKFLYLLTTNIYMY